LRAGGRAILLSMDDEVEAALRRAAGVIREAEGLMAFTGAGISVESGIPPFRGEAASGGATTRASSR